jgi:hypothetical protein
MADYTAPQRSSVVMKQSRVDGWKSEEDACCMVLLYSTICCNKMPKILENPRKPFYQSLNVWALLAHSRRLCTIVDTVSWIN